ncbi:MAG: squalene synthase HpnC [Chlorobiota bacterium]|jgi:squalene synthase HpnC|nr:squalene synthase HpnC [Chlorobiota bacterium]QQS67571.1 MAG: squalene synthase HpnC [Chlorobiota bacterium]
MIKDYKIYTTDEAFSYCSQIAKSNYENFPVGSVIIPKKIRHHFHSIYAFARLADDFADETGLLEEERIILLDDWSDKLDKVYLGEAEHPIFVALLQTIKEKNIPKLLFQDLLRAFKLDVYNKGFNATTDLIVYCAYSANPIGRLILYLYDLASDERCELSDKLCTGLQLANFWQDVSEDIPRNRINVPIESINFFGYSLKELKSLEFNNKFREVMEYHTDHAINMLNQGFELIEMIPNKQLRIELLLTFFGGMEILLKIKSMDFNVLNFRPKITTLDKIKILFKSLKYS